eukprot:CAMPEP_0170189242 /NCGR_PEP_ID=MMETSP0040_2-20121228/46322_1 /TAXON_ID=641309 /ORGANISM="Lotharella oceanica, Strain CCMP622" /LENGTH=100 /DNA_ID=CAMNT_0010436743 /DNA_START=15 /DNA_END=317 /DNA_ORIENTATION=+
MEQCDSGACHVADTALRKWQEDALKGRTDVDVRSMSERRIKKEMDAHMRQTMSICGGGSDANMYGGVEAPCVQSVIDRRARVLKRQMAQPNSSRTFAVRK